MKADFAIYLESGKKFFEIYNTYKAYIKAEDYKDDNWAKGNELLVENKSLCQGMEQAKQRVYAQVSPLADAAEEVSLVDNPLKDHIILAKQLFNTMEEMTEIFAKDQVNIEQLEKEYTILEEKVNQARYLEVVAEYD